MADAGAGEEGSRDVAGTAVESAPAHRVELQRALGGVGAQHDRGILARPRERRIRGVEQRAEEREVQQNREREARQQGRLAAETVAQPACAEHQRRADRDGDAREHRGRGGVHARDALEEVVRVERRRIERDRLADDRAEQRGQHESRVRPVQERLGKGRPRQRLLLFHAAEDRAFLQADPDPERDDEQHGRQQERHAPAPVRKFAGGIVERTAVITASDRSSPPSAIPGIQLVCSPRRSAAACSAT